MPEAWNSSGGSPGWGIDVSTASEQPGPGLPEENTANSANTSNTAPADSVGPSEVSAEEVATAAADSDGLPPDLIELTELNELNEASDVPDEDPDPSGRHEPGTEPQTEPKTGPRTEPETEDERIAREREEFDKLVAAFHSESAPDPQPRRPETPAPRKIVRYPVLDPRPEWHAEIVEPTDETTVDPLDYVEHYEPPDPPLPQVGAATLASWTMLIGGVSFLVLHTLLKWQTPEYLGWLAVIGVFGGIISLVARMKPDRDEYDDPDNGAVV